MKNQTIFKVLIAISLLALAFNYSTRSEEKIFINRELRKTEYIDDVSVIKHTMDTAIISFNFDLRPGTLTQQDVRDFINCVKNIIDNSYIATDIKESDKKYVSVKIIAETTTRDGTNVHLGSLKEFYAYQEILSIVNFKSTILRLNRTF